MDRRSFLGTVTGAGLLASRLTWAAEHKIEKIGLQLYTVRDAMKTDFDGTLAKVAATGYREVEFAGYFDHSPKGVKASLDRVGLVSPSAHFDNSYLGDKWPGVLESAKVIGQQYVVCSFIDEKTRQQPGIWPRMAEMFNRAGSSPQGRSPVRLSQSFLRVSSGRRKSALRPSPRQHRSQPRQVRNGSLLDR